MISTHRQRRWANEGLLHTSFSPSSQHIVSLVLMRRLDARRWWRGGEWPACANNALKTRWSTDNWFLLLAILTYEVHENSLTVSLNILKTHQWTKDELGIYGQRYVHVIILIVRYVLLLRAGRWLAAGCFRLGRNLILSLLSQHWLWLM